MESGDWIKILNRHTDYVYSIVKYVLSGSGDKTIKLWNVYSGECLKTFIGYQALVLRVEILSYENTAGLSCYTIKILKFPNWWLLTFEGHTGSVR